MKVEEVYLSLGSNMGDRLSNLLEALAQLNRQGLRICDVSGIYETEPVGRKEQPCFFNMTALALTELGPEETLQVCQETENLLGRVRRERWGPRTIDIDILFYGTERREDGQLQIPHPRLKERAFVLVPLKEMAPQKYRSLSVVMPGEKVILKYGQSDVKMKLAEYGLIF